MTPAEVLSELEKHGAVIQNTHVVYTSGRHGDTYINKDAIFPDVMVISELCRTIAAEFRDAEVDVVAAPAIGGVVLAHWTAYHLSSHSRPVRAVYAEKDTAGKFVLRRGFPDVVKSRKVLVVEDILTTGGSASAVIEAVRQAGGHVVGLSAICDRGGVQIQDLGHPPRFFALSRLPLDSWPATDCPLCAKGVPVNVEVGKGREFLSSRARLNV